MNEHHSPETILQNVLELTDHQERAAYLDEACAGEQAMRAEVESLLAAHLAADADFMDTFADPVWQEEPTEKTGDMIGRYKLLQQIGEGGFGTVYMAEQTEPVKRRVALKVIKAGMDSKEVIARFEAERQALALMDHPHIAKVHDAGTTEGGRPYFVMELVKGVPLTKYCADKDLNTKARLELFTDVCAAVQHAHQKGVIHRDLKPGNILVTPHDGKPVVKVIDFGIAKAISMELTEKTVFTQFGRMMGTPQYMSPEQAELNALDVDTRSDIYSLGVVLYELLTGSTPLDGTKLGSAAYGEMQRMIREEAPAKPSTKLSEALSQSEASDSSNLRISPRSLRGDLDWIVMKALEKDRSRRYETANGFAMDVRRFLNQEPVTAGPPGIGYKMRKFVRRNRRGVLSGVVTAVALLAGLAAGVFWAGVIFGEKERLAKIDSHASTLLEQAERLMKQNAAAHYEDDSRFRQARNLAEQLKSLDDEKISRALRARRDHFLGAVESEERDRKLILDLEEALMLKMGTGRSASIPEMSAEVESGFTKACQEHGTNPLEALTPETVDWLLARREEVRGRLLAGMLEWAELQREKSPGWSARLVDIVGMVDPDPWRGRLRRAIDEKDRVVLEELAGSDELRQQTLTAVLSLAPALDDAKSWETMEKVLRQVQQQHPGSFWTNFALGMALHDALDPAQDLLGKDAGVRALPMAGGGPKRPKRSHEFDEAIGFMRVAVAIRPDGAVAWLCLGELLAKGGYLEEAIASQRRAIDLKPKFAAAHSNLGNYLVLTDDLREALWSHRRAVRLEPGLANAHNNLGNALRAQGKRDEAMASYKRAIDLDPGLAEAHTNLARVQVIPAHNPWMRAARTSATGAHQEIMNGGDKDKFPNKQGEVNGLVVVTLGHGKHAAVASSIIATALRDAGSGKIKFQLDQKVGPMMANSLESVVNFLKAKYGDDLKNVPTDYKIDIVFEDKDQPVDGPSTGTAMALMLDSLFTGENIDPRFACTGGITTNGKVTPISGVAAKIRGATRRKCTIVGVPEGNAKGVNDILVLDGIQQLLDIQVFAMADFKQALAISRKDKSPEVAETLEAYANVAELIKDQGEAAIKSPTIHKQLEEVLEKMPNHLSAQLLVDHAKGKAPTHLSVGGSFHEIDSNASGVFSIVQMMVFRKNYDHSSTVQETAKESSDELRKLKGKVDERLEDYFDDAVKLCKLVQEGKGDDDEKIFIKRLEKTWKGFQARRKKLMDDPELQKELRG